MGLTAREQLAWNALRNSTRKIHDSRSQSITLGGTGAGTRSERKTVYSGFSPALAAPVLIAEGWEPQEVEAAFRKLSLDRFAAFSGSWNGYVAGHGFMYELDQLPPEALQEYEERFKLSATKKEIEKLATQGVMALADPLALANSIGKLNRLQAEAASGDPAQHPALPALTRYHGLHPELAQAVVLHQQAVPWWAIALIFFFASLAALVFVAALINPHSEAFNDGAGAGPAQYIVSPLFSLLFFAVGIWLWRDLPRRNAKWLAALERYRSSSQ